MFGKSKGQKPRKRQTDGDNNKPKPSLAQMGFLDIPNVSDLALGNIGDNDDDDDSDLEAELLALTSGKGSNGPKRAKKVVKPENLDRMVAECMKDSDDDDQDFDEEDPDLLAELSALGPEEEEEEHLQNEEAASPEASLASPDLKPEMPAPIIIRPSPFVAGTSVVNLLKERIEMYKEAEQNAIETGETSRAKRFNRGLKNLNQMLKDVNSGKSINEEDIPPPVLRHSSRNSSVSDLANLPESKSEPKPENQKEASSTPSTLPQNIAFTENLQPNEEPSSSSPLSIILKRQLEYKKAALAAKKRGSTEEALRLMKTAKQFEPLIQAAKEGQSVDIDSLPTPPSSDEGNVNKNEVNSAPRSIEENKIQKNDNETVLQPESQPQVPVQSTPPNPTSVVEALEQRLAKYTEQRDKAKAEGNARKQRMNDRIIKQYQEAIRTHKLGRHFDFSELPTPPGFPPIPIGGAPLGPSNVTSPASSDSTTLPQYSKTSSEDPQPKPESQPSDVPSGPTQAPKSAPTPKPAPSNVKRAAPSAPPRANVRKNPQSMVERQLSVLKRRREQFKVSALEAKKRGEIEQAKEYIRNYKGIEQLIGATEGGLPVDMNTVPIPPQEKLGCENVSMDFEVIDKEDCVVGPTSDADMALTYSKLEEDLIAQIKMCAHTREHFKALGDVASSNRFEQLILHTKKDLDAVRAAYKRGDTPPRFHYENRTFTLIQCNTDLNDTDCEVCIVRGINFNVANPTDVDTYVKIEFPYPSDAPPQERSNVIKDTNNPEFNHKVVFSIDRKARALSRVFKRHSVKCQVIAKGGWFHRDSVLGNVKIPLVSLETKCTLHDSFDLIDDKKKMVGGKIEVKIRVRNPILTKQLEKVTEKWIIIDGF